MEYFLSVGSLINFTCQQGDTEDRCSKRCNTSWLADRVSPFASRASQPVALMSIQPPEFPETLSGKVSEPPWVVLEKDEDLCSTSSNDMSSAPFSPSTAPAERHLGNVEMDSRTGSGSQILTDADNMEDRKSVV